MKQFLIKLFALLIGFYLLYALLIACFPWRIFYREFAMWASKEEIMDDPKANTLFVIGDSRALSAFLPEKISDHCYNLALGGGTPIEGYFTLQRLIATGKVKKIIVSYAPFHLESTDTFFERTLKFKFLTIAGLSSLLQDSFSLDQKFWDENDLHFNGWWDKTSTVCKAALIYINFPFYYKPELSNLSPINRYEVNMAVYREITGRKGHFNFGSAEFSNGLSKEAERKQFLLNKVCVKYLEMTFELAHAHGIEILYKTAPCNASSFDHLHREYVTGYQDFFKTLKKRYPYVTFDDAIYPASDSLFGDPSHLNRRGCIKFSEEFKSVYLQWLQ